MRLRSVELELPQADAARRFLTDIWGLVEAGSHHGVVYLRGTGDHPYLIALSPAREPSARSISFSGSEEEVARLRERIDAAGVRHQAEVQYDEPGAPRGFVLEGNEGQLLRFVTDSEETAALAPHRDRPVQLTHAVMNARSRDACARFAVEVLGFQLTDRTRSMSFLRCNRAHHAIAFADADVTSLNHMAFEMVDIDAVMRGIGRMKDHGIHPVWGPGRHGPGNNVFGYFVAPFGALIEYTAEVAQIDDSYRSRSPEEWAWPPNRTDQWGVTGRDEAGMAKAERTFRFKPLASPAAGD